MGKKTINVKNKIIEKCGRCKRQEFEFEKIKKVTIDFFELQEKLKIVYDRGINGKIKRIF